MVRIGTLPFRILCLEQGASLVYSEEIIDHKLMDCQKFEQKGFTEWKLTEDDNPVFQTTPREKEKVILQLGTASPERALKAAKLVEDFVAGIDINMGCPKDYSTKGGMGAAMMRTPDLAVEILETLVKNIKIPVTCKIRCLGTIEETVNFAKRMETTGISALAIHGRFKTDRSRFPVKEEYIQAVAEALSIPVLANGGSNTITDFKAYQEFQERTKTRGVLIARAAMWNPSCFNPSGSEHVFTVIPRYCEICLEFSFSYELMKYTL